jgi:hypothetical protein
MHKTHVETDNAATAPVTLWLRSQIAQESCDVYAHSTWTLDIASMKHMLYCGGHSEHIKDNLHI